MLLNNESLVIFWFRRDLRLDDNAALYHALKSGSKVLPIFIFDKGILEKLAPEDKRVNFIWQEIVALKKELELNFKSSIKVFFDFPLNVFSQLYDEFPELNAVFTNRDYEPEAIKRDKEIYSFLRDKNIELKAYKDQVIFDRREVLKDNGEPYTVFTPYMKKWKSLMKPFHLKSYPSFNYGDAFLKFSESNFMGLEELGFKSVDFEVPSRDISEEIIENYHLNRDIPGINGTTRLGIHLRFGTISIRKLARLALKKNEKFFNELIWRDFYQAILYHFPHTVEKAFRPAYDRIEWEKDERAFKLWMEGKTGYPLVDAGMRELNETGFMHNRVRMLVASFLSKHLLLDWRLGEAYFAEKLLDYDQASNIGGWQWAAGCGVDAAPYFRIFNPSIQLKKFDPEHKYLKKWLPDFASPDYPKPIVDHKFARERALKRFKDALN